MGQKFQKQKTKSDVIIKGLFILIPGYGMQGRSKDSWWLGLYSTLVECS